MNSATDTNTDSSLVFHPHVAVAINETIAFGAGVILVNDATKPFDHLLFDRDRARCCCVNDGLQRRHVVLRANALIKFEESNKHRRHDLAVSHLVLLDGS